jgi:hypothetical protein
MSLSIFRRTVPLVVATFFLHSNLPAASTNQIRLGIAYFEPPRSIGTPLEDVARSYSGFGLAARIEGRLRLDTDASLSQTMRELIRQELAARS